MKKLAYPLILGLLSACSSIDTMDQPTIQVYDLNDYDLDGVIAERDRCKDTPLGATVDNYGCPIVELIHQREEINIQFANNSSTIPLVFYSEVEAVANLMKAYPTATVSIEGHTSKTGDYEHNLTLSKNRAAAVSTLLSTKYGIDPKRLSSIGYGYDRPINPAHPAAAVNRRVVIDISNNQKATDMDWHIYSVDEDAK
ncbi:OmpA family protein [Shewanella surugensis]|uniref:OmpA family protein n=1 Tax=Shewanella surugensis TaxID=212020 RepID=A0ABT0LIL7_9GAMM|nr:OmpA family protein [Shewanella surugensis]MCL1127434.1 OmpA family protein [Shewanella surugensis]